MACLLIGGLTALIVSGGSNGALDQVTDRYDSGSGIRDNHLLSSRLRSHLSASLLDAELSPPTPTPVAPEAEASPSSVAADMVELPSLHGNSSGDSGARSPDEAPSLCAWPWECEIATRVQHCENPSQDPWRISATGDYGIMQINRLTWEWWLNQRGFNFETEWMIPERNVDMAFAIWENSWWWPWSCF